MPYFLAFAIALILINGPVHAGYKEGEAAFKLKDYDSAMREFRQAAANGNARAMAARLHVPFRQGRSAGLCGSGEGVSKGCGARTPGLDDRVGVDLL
jgi:hypothetical protein